MRECEEQCECEDGLKMSGRHPFESGIKSCPSRYPLILFKRREVKPTSKTQLAPSPQGEGWGEVNKERPTPWELYLYEHFPGYCTVNLLEEIFCSIWFLNPGR
jgi:hypothetical protein